MTRDEIFEGPCDLSNMQQKYVFFQKGILGDQDPKICQKLPHPFLSGWLDL